MVVRILILSILLFLSCTTSSTKKVIPEKLDKGRITILSVSGASDKQYDRILKAKKKIDSIVKTKCFEDFFLNRKLIKTNGKSNKEVINDLRSNHHSVDIIMYSRWYSSVHGYTYPNVDKIWLNRKYHTSISVCAEASNLHHEISHKYGYGHDFRPSYQRQFSVPYSINAMYKVCCK